MSSLPPDIDFNTDRSASPERMNRAMSYLWAQILIAAANQPELQAAIDEIRATGYQRLSDALSPLVLQAQADAATLDQVVADWTSGDILTALKVSIEGEFNPQFLALTNALARAVPATAIAGQTLQSSGSGQAGVWVDQRQRSEAERWFHFKR